jgi:dTDP-4-dehydrorhamnose 3,5-epimerase
VEVTAQSLAGVLVIEPKVFEDARGVFFETLRADAFAAAGIPPFVQENHSISAGGVLRGLHYQLDRPQGKLVRVVRGTVYDVAVDIRVGSPSFGRWIAAILSAENRRLIYVPPGFAHGFCVVEGPADVVYKCTDYYSGAADQRGVAWNDPGLAIPWPITNPQLSDKDQVYETLGPGRPDLPRFGGDIST